VSERPLALLRVATRPFESLRDFEGEASASLGREVLGLEEEIERRASRLLGVLHGLAGDRVGEGDAEGARIRLAILGLKRDIHNGRLPREADLARARVRIPPAVATEIEEYVASRARKDAIEPSWRQAVDADVTRARETLAKAIADPLVAEGLWLASRSLLAGLERLSGTEPATWGHKERHLAGKAAAYLARFCTKTSPNGLFCATALAKTVDGALAVDGSPTIATTDLLLNVSEARKVAACLAIDPSVESAIEPRPNPTLREADGAWTYWKPATMREPEDDEVLSRVKDHDVLRAFLEEAGGAGSSVGALLDTVSRRCGVARADLAEFYRQLVDRGILIAEIETAYNARRPLADLAAACRAAGCAPAWLPAVESVEAAVDALPGLALRERMAAIERIGQVLESLPHNRPLKHDELVRVDAASALRVRLPFSIVEEVRELVRPYVRLFTAMYPERMHRSALASRFLSRFPSDCDVGLLDVYHGVFESEDKQRPVAFPDPGRVAVRGSGTREASEALARARDGFARLASAAAPGEEVAVTDDEIAAIVGGFPEPRWSCGVLFQIEAEGAGQIARGEFRLVLSALFQGTGLALARFSHLLGLGAVGDENPVVRELRRGWSCLERPGAILAELTYNHNFRTANAGLRPSIFEHEIELPGEKASPGAKVIPLRDLTVRWDSPEQRFLLRWTHTGDEVIPVINSGVNPVGVIAFLIQIGQQGLQPLGYFPGFEARGIGRWPRIVCGRMVLFRERWSFGPGEWPSPERSARGSDHADGLLRVARWRKRHGIPRHVFVHSSTDPKPRYVDLESPVFVEMLLRSASAPGDLQVTEMLPGPDGMWIADDRGRYASEFLVHLQGPRLGVE